MENKLDIMQELLRQAVNERVDDKLDQIIAFIESLKSNAAPITKTRKLIKRSKPEEPPKPTLLLGRATLVPKQEKVPVKR